MNREVIANCIENGFNVHDKYKTLTVEELREVCVKESFPFRVCALNVEGDLNIGMMARTASILGVEKFYIFGRRKVDARSFVGAQNYLPIEKVAGLNKDGNLSLEMFKELVKKDNLLPVFIEQGGIALENGVVFKKDVLSDKIPCLVFGNEASGIPMEFMKHWFGGKPSIIVSLPQLGVLRSLNVAATASIVMWEFSKVYRK